MYRSRRLRAFVMDRTKERRKEHRLHYELPVRFGDGSSTASQAVLVDISSRGMAFICYTDKNCPCLDQKLTTCFSIPRFGTRKGKADMQNITRTGRVVRIDNVGENQCRVAIQFDEPPFWDMPPRQPKAGRSAPTRSNTLLRRPFDTAR